MFALLDLVVVSRRQGLRGEILLNQWMKGGQKNECQISEEAVTNTWTRLGIASGVVAALATDSHAPHPSAMHGFHVSCRSCGNAPSSPLT
jgi:hypothetical protein